MRCGPERGRPCAVAAIAIALWLLGVQAPAAADGAAPWLDDAQSKLRGVQQGLDSSETHRRTLANDIAAFKGDRARFDAALLAITAKTADSEGRIAEVESRLAILTHARAAAQHSLAARQAATAAVLAALQRMGRKPPPALLVAPDDVLKAIRTAMLLGAVLPGMRAEIDALAGDLAELTRTGQAIAVERRTLDAGLAALGSERERLSALVDARQEALGKAQGDLQAERDTAKQLAAQAGSLKELIARLERDDKAVGGRGTDDRLAALVPNGIAPNGIAPGGVSPQGGVPDGVAPPSGEAAEPQQDGADASHLAPAIAFAATRGHLALPAAGAVLRRFGEDDGLGGSEKGMLLQTRTGATVASPADGWIAYAGPYRSFGQLLILNTGGGYYIVLAGMDRVNVGLGQFVLAGEPVAAMGDGPTKTAAAVALGAVQPILYVEFRKDGATIDPGPWWAKPELQKVRG